MKPSLKKEPRSNRTPYNRVLFFALIALMLFGVIMVTSSSITLLDQKPYFYAQKEITYLIVALICFFIVLSIPVQFWFHYNWLFLLITIVLLVLVFFVGPKINGARRWIPFILFNFQPAELAKFTFFCYLASYLARRYKEVRLSIYEAYIKPVCIIFLPIAALIVFEPDLGTVIVLVVVMLALFFISGANIYVLLGTLSLVVLTAVALIVFVSYRFERMAVFLDPWSDPMNKGYQLINSFMAIGNGGFFGKGLGNSTLKLNYLPEAHTDFIFSILAEELGYVGVLLLLCLFIIMVFQALKISRSFILYADKQQHMPQILSNDSVVVSLFSGYLAFAIGIWVGIQSLINLFVATGLAPPKGLTLPFISYGGSSLIVMSISIALLLRIDYEYKELR